MTIQETPLTRISWQFHGVRNDGSVHLDVRLRCHENETSAMIRLRRQLEKQILAIPGVTGVRCEDYRIDVTKASIFGFKEICPQVEEVIKTHLA